MASREDDKTAYDLPDEDGLAGEFSLEEILAEYGGGVKKLLEQAEEPPAPPPSRRARPPEPPAPESPPPAREEPRLASTEDLTDFTEDLPDLTEELPSSPRPISMEEVVGFTVDAVMEEQTEPLLRPRRGLFSRRRMEETEQLYAPPEPEPEVVPEAQLIGPEPENLSDTAEEYRRQARSREGGIPAAFCLAILPVAALVAERQGVVIPYWTGDGVLQTAVLLALLGVNCLLARHVFVKAAQMLRRKRCTSELLICLSALASAADGVMRLAQPERTEVALYAPVACMALAFAMWGGARESRGMYHTFRTAALDDEPPYLITETEKGACKQRGALPGFYTTAMRDDGMTVWQTALLPVVLVASLVFAGLSSLGQGRGSDFFLNWSAILGAGATFALPLCWGLPFSRMAGHLQKAGCAVGGWAGAEYISRRKSMILTDTDLFPPGTIQLNGVKVYGEEMVQAVAYAATLARSAGCGLQRLFDGLLRGEMGKYETCSDFSFYQEGGYSATIRGQTVLMGTASFMRKMEVRLPPGINLRTGVFLAVDRQITAVFAVKYNAAENVDYALGMIRHNRMAPILAARDPNITPALLGRKFRKGIRLNYPDLTTRVALSEAELDRGMPRALLLREGLLPYADTVVGSRRLCKAVRQSAALSLFSSAAGTLLSFYLVFSGAYTLLTPLSLLLYLVLWTLPVLLLSGWVGRY